MMLGLLLALTYVGNAGGFRLVCTYTSSAMYRLQSGKFVPENIVPQLCTHIVYNVAQPRGLGIAPTSTDDISQENKKGLYERMIGLKINNPDLIVLLAMASPHAQEHPYTAILATPVSRSVFAQNAIAYLRRYRFDGLVISHRHPDDFGIPVMNKEKFVLFLKELRKIFEIDGTVRNVPRLLLCAVLPGIYHNIDFGYDTNGILQYADFISLLTYNYHYNNTNTVQLLSPMHSIKGDPLSLGATVDFITEQGFPKEKIDIGITLGARTYCLADPNENTIGAKSLGGADPAAGTGMFGQMGYYEICWVIQSGGVVIDDDAQQARYVVHGKLWASYEDVRSVILKTCFAKENHFGGVMINALDLDDFNGTFCGQGKFPLVTGIASVLYGPDCKIYLPAEFVHSGQKRVINYLPDMRFMLVGFSLFGLSINYHFN